MRLLYAVLVVVCQTVTFVIRNRTVTLGKDPDLRIRILDPDLCPLHGYLWLGSFHVKSPNALNGSDPDFDENAYIWSL